MDKAYSAEKIKGTFAIAQRIVNGENAFLEVIESRGFSRADAEKAMYTMLRLKVAKRDAGNGVIRVKHGAFLDVECIQNAVDYKWGK